MDKSVRKYKGLVVPDGVRVFNHNIGLAGRGDVNCSTVTDVEASGNNGWDLDRPDRRCVATNCCDCIFSRLNARKRKQFFDLLERKGAMKGLWVDPSGVDFED